MPSARVVSLAPIALVVLGLALAAACGGSASETPFPLEPLGKAGKAEPRAPRGVAAGGSSGVRDNEPGATEALREPEQASPGSDGDAPSTWGSEPE